MLKRLCFIALAMALPRVISRSCLGKCGNVSIPYPFGTKEGCYMSEDFNVECKSGSPFLAGSDPVMKIKSISVATHELIVDTPVVSDCYNESGPTNGTDQSLSVSSPKFPFSNTRNRFTALGCDTMAAIVADEFFTGCFSYCPDPVAVDNSSCSGAGCCQSTNITTGLFSFNITVGSILNRTGSFDFSPCDYAFIADDSHVFHGVSDLKDFGRTKFVPTVLDWFIKGHNCSQAKASRRYACKGSHTTCVDSHHCPGYHCQCSSGFKGNPYVIGGCEDICKHQTCKSTIIKLAVIAGQEKFRTITTQYYKGAQGFIMVYDVTRRETWINLTKIWNKDIDQYKSNHDCVKMLVGNKVDKESERAVTKEEGMHFARKYGCLYLECSAKARINVDNYIEELVLKILESPSLLKEGLVVTKLSNIKLDQARRTTADASSGGCCS